MKSFRTFIFLVLALALLTVVGAFAADPPAAAVPSGTTFVAFVQNTLQPIVESLLGAVLTIGFSLLCAWLKQKWGIEVSNSVRDQAQQISMNAVLAVEEKAANAFKSSGSKWMSEYKHATAVNMVLERLPSLTKEQADRLVHSALALIPGLGATGLLGSPAPAAAGATLLDPTAQAAG